MSDRSEGISFPLTRDQARRLYIAFCGTVSIRYSHYNLQQTTKGSKWAWVRQRSSFTAS